MILKYHAHSLIEDLALGECTMHSCQAPSGARWWQLWFFVARDSDGQPDTFRVPVIPNGSFTESGPGGRTWGLTSMGAGVWQVSPSINVLDTRDTVAGEHQFPSLWHQTPQVSDVPDSELWAQGFAP